MSERHIFGWRVVAGPSGRRFSPGAGRLRAGFVHRNPGRCQLGTAAAVGQRILRLAMAPGTFGLRLVTAFRALALIAGG
jgi:hypothetical protein